MRKVIALGWLLTATLLVTGHAAAQSLTLRGTLTLSPCTALDAVNAVAYTTTSGVFRCISLSDPAHPSQLGQVATGAASVTGLEVEGNYAFGAGQADGLVIVQISNPASPSLVTRFSLGNAARDVAAADTLVAVATPLNVVLVGVRAPGSPHILATYGRAASWIEFESSGRRLHVGSTAGVFSLDVNVHVSGHDTTFTLALGEEYGSDVLTPVALCGSFVDVVHASTLIALHADNYSVAGQRQAAGAIRALTAGTDFSFAALGTGSVEYLDQRANTPQLVTTAAVPGSPDALALGSSGSHRLLVAAHTGGVTVYEYDALPVEPQNSPAVPSQLALAAFPNPFNSVVVLRIESAQPGACELRICDLLGREVEREIVPVYGSATRTLDFRSRPAGLYLAELRKGESAVVTKLLYVP
jgi:hypothetical protein